MATDIVAASPVGLGSYPNLANGSFTSAGNAVSIVLGFNPRHVTLINETDNIVLTKFQGQPIPNCLKEAASAQTIDTTGLVTFPADAGLNEPGSAILLSAAAAGTGKAWSFSAFG